MVSSAPWLWSSVKVELSQRLGIYVVGVLDCGIAVILSAMSSVGC